MSEFQTLQYEEVDRVGVLTINRPDKLNALDATVLSELKTFLSSAQNKRLTGLILTGAGEKAFIAGADILAMTTMDAKAAGDFGRLGQNVSVMFEYLPYPTIAAVHGFALGGGFEMALSCDFIFASEKAVFGLPEVKLGLLPGFGGTSALRAGRRRRLRKRWCSLEKISRPRKRIRAASRTKFLPTKPRSCRAVVTTSLLWQKTRRSRWGSPNA